MRSLSRLTPVVLLGVALSAALGPTVAAFASVDQPQRGGDVVIVDGANRGKEVDRGGSDAKWTLRIPAGASCPGDSMHDEWRVQSFIVPATVDPASLTYESTKPAGDTNFALYDYLTHPFVQQLTRANDVAGQPGVIGDIPTLSFAVFPPGTLPAGDYRIGIACTLGRQTAVYWDTSIVLAVAPDDQPGQLTWRLPSVDANAPIAEASGSSNTLVYVLVAVAAAAITYVIWRRRSASDRSRIKESR